MVLYNNICKSIKKTSHGTQKHQFLYLQNWYHTMIATDFEQSTDTFSEWPFSQWTHQLVPAPATFHNEREQSWSLLSWIRWIAILCCLIFVCGTVCVILPKQQARYDGRTRNCHQFYYVANTEDIVYISELRQQASGLYTHVIVGHQSWNRSTTHLVILYM